MKRIQKFYKCNECGNIIGVINNTGIPLHCCNKEMEELIPKHLNYSSSSGQKSQILNPPEHGLAPIKKTIFKINNNTSDSDNSISLIIDKAYLSPESLCWAYLKTEKGGQRKNLINKDYPIVDFKIVDDTPISAYFYCSNQGLFKMDFK